MSPLASGAVYVTERYATRPGDPYVIKATNLTTAIALLELILIEVVYGMYLTYGTTISAASFALGGSSNGSLVEPSEVRKLELKQGTKLQLW